MEFRQSAGQVAEALGLSYPPPKQLFPLKRYMLFAKPDDYDYPALGGLFDLVDTADTLESIEEWRALQSEKNDMEFWVTDGVTGLDIDLAEDDPRGYSALHPMYERD